MKNIATSFGLLVRPRVVTSARILPSPDINEQDIWSLNKLVDTPSYYKKQKDVDLFNKPYEELFSDLLIGDTKKSLTGCYVGVITSFITSIKYRQHILVDKKNVAEILQQFSDKYGSKQFPVHYVGIKFYKSVQKNELTEEIEPIDPWTITNEQTWFYRPWDLVTMDTIIRYEQIIPGDLVLFKRTNGIVIKAKTIYKKKFYKTNSWSSRSVMVFNNQRQTIIRFLPNKSFKKI